MFPGKMCFSTMVASQIPTKKKKKKKLDEDKPFHEEKSKKSHVSCTNGFDGEKYIAEIRRYTIRHFSKIGYIQEMAVKVKKGSKFQTFKHLKHQGLLNSLSI